MNILIAIGIVLVGGVACAGSSYLLANNDTEAAIIGLVGGVLAGIAIRLVL